MISGDICDGCMNGCSLTAPGCQRGMAKARGEEFAQEPSFRDAQRLYLERQERIAELRKIRDCFEQAIAEHGAIYLKVFDDKEMRCKCKAVTFHMLKGDRLYFGIGVTDAFYGLLRRNTNVKFVDHPDEGRESFCYSGKVVFHDGIEGKRLSKEALAEPGYDELKETYTIEGEKRFAVFHLEQGDFKK